ncbi:hypothetical protein QR680_013836 [Steinernema hermaphroditum]|uniref:WAP domain-containing protein n=1 Tax=Steinernema hermaphroditum TaxID=289476 RepID=A0AA39M370_9BILA|nr:hypothetical protein QR680_013836 [Steinernema hermaphroditum]
MRLSFFLSLAALVGMALCVPQRMDVCVINMDQQPCPPDYPFCRILDGLWECCIEEAAGTEPCPIVPSIQQEREV